MRPLAFGLLLFWATTGFSADFYVDPASGTKLGEGSSTKPWRTLQEVITSGFMFGPKAKVRGGDTVWLMTGDHGGANLSNMVNTDWVTIKAGRDQKPVLRGLFMKNSAQWAFDGLTICPDAAPGSIPYAVTVRPVDDLVFINNTVCSTLTEPKWTAEEWQTKSYTGVIAYGKRQKFEGNTFRFLRRGLLVEGEDIQVLNNTIDYWFEDGIDFTANRLTIKGNRITNHYGQAGGANHNDGIQGWALDGIPRDGLVIDSNVVLESTGDYATIPRVPTGVGQDYIQGISVFDGVWRNSTITNNTIACSANHGLSFYGFQGMKIQGNTIFRLSSNPAIKVGPWLGVFNSKLGVPSSDVVVRNNLANNYSLTAGVTQDHNLTFTALKGNPIPLADPALVFVQPDATKGLDLRLKTDNPAVGSGIDGVNLGAHN